ncbi:hypothetical protein BGZ94_000881, partial [Podila epigama]
MFDSKVPGVTILAKVTPEQAQILTPEALQFIATLHRSFNGTRKTLLQKRVLRQQQIDQGILPDFLPETKAILPGLTILAKVTPAQAEFLTPESLELVATLHRTYEATRQQLLQRRKERQIELDNGRLPDFLPETRAIREDATWRAAKPAPGLQDRRVEITGPVDRKMVINALNSGAATFMADFE